MSAPGHRRTRRPRRLSTVLASAFVLAGLIPLALAGVLVVAEAKAKRRPA